MYVWTGCRNMLIKETKLRNYRYLIIAYKMDSILAIRNEFGDE